MPTYYQAQFYRALNKLEPDIVEVIFESDVPPDRKKLGWKEDYNGYRYMYCNEIALRNRFFLESNKYHFISGVPGGMMGLIKLLLNKQRIRFCNQSEMPSPFDNIFLWKIGAYIYSTFLRAGINRDLFLGIGEDIRKYFSKLNVPEEKILPYMYFYNSYSGQINKVGNYEGDLIFIGQLIERKGIDILIKAFALSNAVEFRKLRIYGTGSESDNLKVLAKKLNVSNSVIFEGPIEYKRVEAVLKNKSCLILPSRYDGWGVVINEAISNGVPVISSSKSGAKELVQNGECGFVYNGEEHNLLSYNINQMFGDRTLWEAFSNNATKYAVNISPGTGAQYFLEIKKYALNYGVKPSAPWILKKTL